MFVAELVVIEPENWSISKKKVVDTVLYSRNSSGNHNCRLHLDGGHADGRPADKAPKTKSDGSAMWS